jgi:threonine/homoserine/homoserine lactone efflux protein
LSQQAVDSFQYHCRKSSPKEPYKLLYYLILGITFAFAAAIQPGPLQSYLISQTLSKGWRHTLPASCAPLISDGPIIVLVVLILSRIPPWLISVLQCAGGLFLLYLTFNAWKSWKTYDAESVALSQSSRTSVMQATFVNFLSPSPYLGWSLVMGPLLLKGWNEAPMYGIALLTGFYSSIVLTQIGIIFLFAFARKFGPRVTRSLLGCSVAVLACFGVYQLWLGGKHFWQ